MFVRFTLIICVLVLTFGCQGESPVSVELVPKDRSGIEWMRDLGPSSVAVSSSVGGAASSDKAAEATRMVVAIFQRSEGAWFFKITGSPEKVAQSESAWQPFIDAVEFESAGGSERPVWELPEGWSLGGKAQMVFAILKMPDDDGEIRISRLGGQQDLLSNVNRWRGQLGLPACDADSLDENLVVRKGQGGEYRLFDQEGKSAGQSMGGRFSGGPFMRQQAMLQAAKDKGKAADKTSAEKRAVQSPETIENDLAANPRFTLEPPEGYSPGKTSAMVVARYLKETDDGKVQITLVPLTATNQWDDNVNFWRQSVGLGPIDADEIKSATQAVTIGGVEGKKIALLAEDAGADEKSLIGVMVKHNDAAWFFKMMGDPAMVEADQPIFDTFLESFEFTDGP